jgi:hypothetical protein
LSGGFRCFSVSGGFFGSCVSGIFGPCFRFGFVVFAFFSSQFGGGGSVGFFECGVGFLDVIPSCLFICYNLFISINDSLLGFMNPFSFRLGFLLLKSGGLFEVVCGF